MTLAHITLTHRACNGSVLKVGGTHRLHGRSISLGRQALRRATMALITVPTRRIYILLLATTGPHLVQDALRSFIVLLKLW